MANGFKSGGRSKGTPNKTTTELRQLLADLLTYNIDTLQTDIETLQPKDRVRALIEISRLILPSVKAIDLNDNNDTADNEIIVRFIDANDRIQNI